MTARHIIAINLSPNQGGAEVYTEFFVRAVVALGYRCTLHVSPAATFWKRDALAGCSVVAGKSVNLALAACDADALIVNHTSLPHDWLSVLAEHPRFISFAHHVITSRNKYAYYTQSRRLLAVSEHVIETCEASGLENLWPTPLYGVAYSERSDTHGEIVANPRYEWDKRKPRDRVLTWLSPYLTGKSRTLFTRRPGVTIGIVSRLAELKQFPALFTQIAPQLANLPNVNLEVFGSGVYREVRRIEKSLSPLGERVRFWGWQTHPHAIYPQLDYLLAGLPEREALGLNVIEAQMLGTPVLAVNAPPFTETVFEGITGRLYGDPRKDGGQDFAKVIAEVAARPTRIDLESTRARLALSRFSFDAYCQRLGEALEGVAAEL